MRDPLPWYGVMYSLHGMAFIETFLGFHNVTRFLEPEHASGVIWYYYLPVLLIGAFPWSSVLMQSLVGALREKGASRDICRFLVIWATVVFVFFSVSQTKLVSYILPMYPPLSFLIGYYFDRIWRWEEVRALRVGAVLFAGVAMVLGGGVLYAGTVFGEMWAATVALAMILAVGAILAIWQSVKGRFCHVFVIQIISMMTFLVVLMLSAVPALVDGFSVRPLVSALEDSYDGYSPIYIEKFFRPGIAYYTDRAGEELPLEDLSKFVNEQTGKTYVIMKNRRYSLLDDETKRKTHILAWAEDDKKLGNLVKYMLEKSGVRVDWVLNGGSVLEYAMYEPYDVIALDWMMPGQSGIEVCEQLRKQGYHGAVLMLTARDSIEDRVLGLNTGADDYIVKPFEFAELIARLHALARRSRMKLDADVTEIGDLVINGLAHYLRRQGVSVQLTCREFQLLDILLRNRNCVVPRELILDRVWGLEADVSSNNLDVYVRLLRKKLKPFEDVLTIKTVRGIGYKLEVQDVC